MFNGPSGIFRFCSIVKRLILHKLALVFIEKFIIPKRIKSNILFQNHVTWGETGKNA